MGFFKREYVNEGEDELFLGNKYDEWGEEEESTSDLIRGASEKLKDDYED